MDISNSQPVGNKPTQQSSCLCLPFATLACWAQSCLSNIADFFKNLFCSTRRLESSRITLPPPAEPMTSPTTEPVTPEQPVITPAIQIPKPLSSQRCLPSHLIDFYQGAINDRGITLTFLLEQADDAFLESYHFWVQWAFPQQHPAGSNPTAPLLDQETINRFRTDPQLQAQLLKMFKRVLCFFGLKLQEEGGAIVKGENFAIRARASWLKPSDHNHLRITRILDSLRLLQPPTNSLSIPFFTCLKQIQQETAPKEQVCASNFSHWKEIHPTI
jgi:hypothetical protein